MMHAAFANWHRAHGSLRRRGAAAALPLADLDLDPAPLVDLDGVEYHEFATHHVVLAGWRDGESLRNTLPRSARRGCGSSSSPETSGSTWARSGRWSRPGPPPNRW